MSVKITSSEKSTANAWLKVDLGALADNYSLFKSKLADNTQAGAVIKANGYGLGAKQVLAALENQNCPIYFVATLEEALEIRPLTQKTIAVLGGLYYGAEQVYIHENILPVLNSLEEIDRYTSIAENLNIALPCLIQFDTGMSRLGLGEDETLILHQEPARLKGLFVEYMISHFACSDELDHPMNNAQFEKFVDATEPFPKIKKSLANSSGVMRSHDYHFDLIRPGIGLYGGNPTPETTNPMKPVAHLYARVLQVRNVKKDDSVGYSATYRFDKNTQVATVALGYADGFLRSISNNGHFYFEDQPCPIIGRVSMDAVTVNVGALKNNPKPGDMMEVLGKNQSVDELANNAGTIGYEILTDLGRRYNRSYSG